MISEAPYVSYIMNNIIPLQQDGKFDEIVKTQKCDTADLVYTGLVSQHQEVASCLCLHRVFVPHMGEY